MELAISIISLITSIIALFAAVCPLIINKQKQKRAEFDRKYNELRTAVASALPMYACCYHNPINLAKRADHKLPPEYETAQTELRKLGATASALAATMPEKGKKLNATRVELGRVSECLIGLSNSMSTPYGVSQDDRDCVRDIEKEIRDLLHIEQ